MGKYQVMPGNDRMVAAGTDEAGRGPLAGPVVAAAVILTNEQRKYLLSKGLKDSKKTLTIKERDSFLPDLRVRSKVESTGRVSL